MRVEKRRKPRKGCKIPASVRTGTSQAKAYLVDLNEFGVRLVIENSVRAVSEGDEVEIHTQEFGLLKGRARWRSSHRIGIELSDGADLLLEHTVSRQDTEKSTSPKLPAAQFGMDEILSDHHKIADDLARLAARPEMFTKAEMADLMKRAAQKMRRDERVLVSMKQILSEAIFVRRGADQPASAE